MRSRSLAESALHEAGRRPDPPRRPPARPASPPAISCAKLGPDNTATRAPGAPSEITSAMVVPCAGSSPFDAQTRMHTLEQVAGGPPRWWHARTRMAPPTTMQLAIREPPPRAPPTRTPGRATGSEERSAGRPDRAPGPPPPARPVPRARRRARGDAPPGPGPRPRRRRPAPRPATPTPTSPY